MTMADERLADQGMSGEPDARESDSGEVSPLDVHEAASKAFASVSDFSRTADAFVKRQARERPYAMLGVAVAAGYVLGGGLPSRFTALIGATAGRLLLSHFVESLAAEPAPSGSGAAWRSRQER